MLRKTMPCGKDLRSRTHRAVRPHINCHLVFEQRTTRSLGICLSLSDYKSYHDRETELFRTFALESWLFGPRRSSSVAGLGTEDSAAKGSSSSTPNGAQAKAVGAADPKCGPVSTRGSPITDINVSVSRTGIERGFRPARRCLTHVRMPIYDDGREICHHKSLQWLVIDIAFQFNASQAHAARLHWKNPTATSLTIDKSLRSLFAYAK